MESSARNMQRARFEIIGLALLALGLGSGCSSDGSDTEKGDGGNDGGNNGSANQGSNENGGEDAGENNGSNANNGNNDPIKDAGPKDSGPPDTGVCTPMYNGCDDKYPGVDPATLCGQIDNGCGVMIDCDPEDDNCAGFDGACNDPAKPNQCGCAPKTCADVVPGGAECGDDIDDGCGGEIATSCGTCTGQDVCSGSPSYACECVPNNAACNGKVCGTAPDGCTGTVSCGDNAGQCATGTCSEDQTQCACPARDVACAGKPDGALTVNGCNYVCGACVPNNAAACGAAECGTATNNCGDVVNCGSNAGGCAAGNTCIDPTYVESATAKVCVDNDLANLVGTYAVRTHAFRHAAASIDTYQRAEALSLVKVTLKAGTREPRMVDYGCAASSVGFPNTPNVTSNAANYSKIAPVEVDLEITGNGSGTGGWTRDIVKTYINDSLTTDGVPTGFWPESPDYCKDKAGDTVPAPDAASRPWLTDGKCVCPADATAAAALPPSNSASKSQDCRVTDADADMQPGFTVTASFGSSADVYNVSISGVTWKGALRADGFHTGVAIEPPTVNRAVVGCTPGFLGGALCSGAATPPQADCACGDVGTGQYNFIQFAPLDGLTKPANEWTCADVKSNALGGTFSLFKQPYGSCTNNSGCPTGSVCKSNSCYAATTTGACGTGTNVTCPAGMECLQNACWPLQSECPATSPCTNPPNN